MLPAAESAGHTVRVVSFNICGFGAGFGPVDVGRVTEVYGRLRQDLKRLRPDVLCLQEAKRLPVLDPEGRERADSLDALAEDLGGMDVRFAHANPGYESFGNAVLVGPRLRVEGSGAEFLEGGSVIHTPAGATKRLGRGCVAARLALIGQSAEEVAARFAVLATHWDHIAEGERVVQAKSLLKLRDKLSDGLPHLLVGDMNAMKRSDYSVEEWSALEERSKQKRWTPPADSDALALLEQDGYVDAQQFAWGQSRSAGSRWTTLGPPPARIDYAFMSKDWQAVGGTFSSWVDEETTSSDHQPVVLDLTWP